MVRPIRQTATTVFISWLAAMISTGTQAKVMPTASASMLVATAIRNMVLTSSAAEAFSSSLLSASRIMLPPISASSTKAIHDATALMYISKPAPSR